VGEDANPQKVITAKVLVQPKNLFRLKCGLGPCLDDAKTPQNQPLHCEFLQNICLLYSGSETTKADMGEGVSLSQLQNIAEATSPVKNKKTITLSIVNCKQFYIFPPKDLLLFYIFLPKTCCALSV
jgi:hypothetical protein